MDKLRFNPKTIDDEIVFDALTAVAKLDDVPASRGSYMVVGGMATQGYLPEHGRRPTSDLDLCIGRPLNRAEFEEFSKPMQEYFKDMGYEIETKKAQSNFKVYVRQEDGDAIVVEFSRRSPARFEKDEKRLERELSNARSRLLEDGSDSYKIASPEDIVVPKLVREIGSLYRNPQFEEKTTMISGDIDGTYVDTIKERLAFLRGMVNGANNEKHKRVLGEEVRFISDLFDMRMLATYAGINRKYFGVACSDWSDKLGNPEFEEQKGHIIGATSLQFLYE